MQRQKMIALLKQADVMESLADGPTALMVTDNGKDRLLLVKQEGDFVKVTTGGWFRRSTRIPRSELEG